MDAVLGVLHLRAAVPREEHLDLRLLPAAGSPSRSSASRPRASGPVGNSNGKVLLNGPYANTFNDIGACLFGVIIIAAIFGTSILRDFQRDTYQMIFTKPISKFAYLGGRWAGSFVTTVFAFSGMMFGTYLGTFAPWADHARIGPNHLWWYLQPFLSIIVVQIFFLGSLFFAVAALTRKIFIVYLQGVALFMIYLIGLTVVFRDALARALLVRHSRSDRARAVRQRHRATGPWSRRTRCCCRGTSAATRRASSSTTACSGRWSASLSLVGDVGAVSHVGRGAHGQVAGEARGEGAAAGRRRRRARSARSWPRACRASASSSARARRFIQYLSLTRLRVRTILREISVLGDRRADDRVRDQQRAVRRTRGRGERLARHLSHAAGRGRQRDALLLSSSPRSTPRELIWRERDSALRRHPRRAADGRVRRLALASSPPSRSWSSSCSRSRCSSGMLMQTLAGYYHYELLPVLQGAVRRHLPADARLRAVRAVRADHGVEQVRRPRDRDRHVRAAADPLQLRLGEHALSAGRDAAVHLLGHERLRPLRARAVLGDHLLVCDLRVAGRDLDRVHAARRGRLARARARVSRVRALRGCSRRPRSVLADRDRRGSRGTTTTRTCSTNISTRKALRHIQADYERDFKKYELLPAARRSRPSMRRSTSIPERRSFDGHGRASRCRTSRPQPIVADPPHRRAAVGAATCSFDRPFHLVSQRTARSVLHLRSSSSRSQPGDVVTHDVHGRAHDARLSRRQ